MKRSTLKEYRGPSGLDSSNVFTVRPSVARESEPGSVAFTVEPCTIVLTRAEAINLSAWLSALTDGAEEIARMVAELQMVKK